MVWGLGENGTVGALVIVYMDILSIVPTLTRTHALARRPTPGL